jgi:hypothetical protein
LTPAPPVGFSCCDCRNWPPALSELGRPSCGGGRWGGGGTLSLLGSGLLRSTRPPWAFETRAVCEDVGVAWVELAGDCVPEPWGDAVPEVDWSPFFFEDLLESLPLESCCCWPCQRRLACGRANRGRALRGPTTRCLKFFMTEARAPGQHAARGVADGSMEGLDLGEGERTGRIWLRGSAKHFGRLLG